MIVCNKCGNSNPLGRVFCGACGAKLDLSGMTTDNMQAMTRRRIISLKWLNVLWLVVVALIVMVGLAFWPDPAPIGKEGTRLGMERVASSIRSLIDLKKGRTLGREFTEEDINGYFKFDKAAKLKAESITVKAFEGYVQVRVVRAMDKLQLGSIVIAPRISYDLFCVPMGSLVRVSKVRMGHLGWLGPLRTSVVRSMYQMVASEKEWAMFGNMTELKPEPGKVTIVLTKN